jgi:hypothetical protein
MIETIAENGLQDKVCHQMDMGMLQEVIPPSLIEELLETYQMWEERERKTNMVTIVYWLIALGNACWCGSSPTPSLIPASRALESRFIDW